jgi:hypothetical protein
MGMKQASSTESSKAPRTLPYPQLKELHNLTDLPHFQFMDMGAGRKFFDVVVVKASFDLKTGVAQLSADQSAPCLADDLWRDTGAQPEYASMKAVGDTVLFKPFTDVYVTGTVRSFQNKPQTNWYGLLCVRRGKELLINKTLRFTGPRHWLHKARDVWKLTPPSATTQVPLRYELAYGGHYLDPKALQTLTKQQQKDAGTGAATEIDPDLATQVFAANPAGSGLFGLGSSSSEATHQISQSYPAPQIEWPTDNISTSADINFKTYQPAGWGPIARWWRPRVERQGSYDAAWLHDFAHNPLGYADYPKDFDYSYFNCAPADQMVKGALNGALQGDEFIELVDVFADKEAVSLQLPSWKLQVDLFDHRHQWLSDQMRLDTLHIDLDTQQLHATWRLTLRHEQRISHCMITEAS